MKRKLLSPLADPIFKRIFGEEKDIMMSLINAAIELKDPVVEIEYLQPELVDPNSQMEGIHFHFIELSKFMKNGTFDLKNPLQAWMKFFAEPEYFSTMPIKHYETFEKLKENLKASSSHYPLLTN